MPYQQIYTYEVLYLNLCPFDTRVGVCVLSNQCR